MNIKQTDKEYVANTYRRFPVQIVRGRGSLVYDENGKEYIDMGSGIAVNCFGVSDDEWIEAVTRQLNKFQHTSNLYYSEPCARLAKILCERTGMKKVFFSNSGAEANECAIKVARKYAADTKGREYTTILTLKNSFHGRTITTLAATGQDVYHTDFHPLTPGFDYIEANNISDLYEKTDSHKTAAIMFECIQGEGGVTSLSREFIKAIADIAEKNNILTIVDEVQTGNGRTGKLYSYMHYGIVPDIVSTAKGLGGGLPIGATLMGEKVRDVLGYGSHGSTYGGNPVCCAGAINILERVDERLMAEVSEKSNYIFDELSGAKGIKSLSGLGLMIGVETEADPGDIISACIEQGVLLLSAKNKLRLLPALNISMGELERAISVIKTACRT